MRFNGQTFFSIATAAVVLLFTASSAWAVVDTQNLVRNGDFEEPGSVPPGWKIVGPGASGCTLTTDALTGKNALKLSLPASGSVTVSGDAVAVSAGTDYLITYWGRAEGPKDGGTLTASLVWQDDHGKELSRCV